MDIQKVLEESSQKVKEGKLRFSIGIKALFCDPYDNTKEKQVIVGYLILKLL